MPALGTILLVDDDAAVRAVVKHALAQAGYLVQSVGDGQEALAWYEANGDSTALLITDLQMPNVGGLELARRLRRLLPSLPLVFMSGDSPKDALPTEEEFPGHLYLRKPFLPSELIARLPAIMNSHF